jgi:hypothetical protein
MNRCLGFALLFAMVLCLCPSTAYAWSGPITGGGEYDIAKGLSLRWILLIRSPYMAMHVRNMRAARPPFHLYRHIKNGYDIIAVFRKEESMRLFCCLPLPL